MEGKLGRDGVPCIPQTALISRTHNRNRRDMVVDTAVLALYRLGNHSVHR